MPYFDENPLCKLAAKPAEADVELNLSGLTEAQALEQIEALLREGPGGKVRRVHIHFDPPQGDGRETLFLPVGRRLLSARKAGRLASCLPATEGNGYHIVLADNAGDRL